MDTSLQRLSNLKYKIMCCTSVDIYPTIQCNYTRPQSSDPKHAFQCTDYWHRVMWADVAMLIIRSPILHSASHEVVVTVTLYQHLCMSLPEGVPAKEDQTEDGRGRFLTHIG